MTGPANPKTHTSAFLELLTDGGLVVGDGGPPAVPYGGLTRETFIKYVIVYSLGSSTDGGLVDPHEDTTLNWQVTCVGFTREQSEWLVNRVNDLVVDQHFAVDGRTVGPIEPDLVAAGPRRDDDVRPAVFFATPRYRAYSRP